MLVEYVDQGPMTMETSLIEQGSSLMLYGMGVVFVFLALLVLMIFVMSSVIRRFFPEPEASAAVGVGATAHAGVDEQLKKVVQAAIDQHRR